MTMKPWKVVLDEAQQAEDDAMRRMEAVERQLESGELSIEQATEMAESIVKEFKSHSASTIEQLKMHRHRIQRYYWLAGAMGFFLFYIVMQVRLLTL